MRESPSRTGRPRVSVRVAEAFSLSTYYELLGETAGWAGGSSGCMASYLGLVKGVVEGKKVLSLIVESSREELLEAIGEAVDKALAEGIPDGLAVMHRVGELRPGDPVLAIIAVAGDRDSCFSVVRTVLESLKSSMLIRKREVREDGEYVLVGGRRIPLGA